MQVARRHKRRRLDEPLALLLHVLRDNGLRDFQQSELDDAVVGVRLVLHAPVLVECDENLQHATLLRLQLMSTLLHAQCVPPGCRIRALGTPPAGARRIPAAPATPAENPRMPARRLSPCVRCVSPSTGLQPCGNYPTRV